VPLPPTDPPLLRRSRREDMQRRRHQGSISARAPRPQGGEGARHIGIICNGCHARDFVGIRFRCLDCQNYDLCATCHARRSSLHPIDHNFETIVTPRMIGPSFLADFMARAATRTVVAIIELGTEDLEARSGLDEQGIAWWLADDERLVSVDQMVLEEPSWCCPICAEGVEAECENGFVVRICNGGGEGQASAGIAKDEAPAGGAGDAEGGGASNMGHIYHETCLRRWLVKKNTCPVCRRSPVVPDL